MASATEVFGENNWVYLGDDQIVVGCTSPTLALRLGYGDNPLTPKEEAILIEIFDGELHVYCDDQENVAKEIRDLSGVERVDIYGGSVGYIRVIISRDADTDELVRGIRKLLAG